MLFKHPHAELQVFMQHACISCRQPLLQSLHWSCHCGAAEHLLCPYMHCLGNSKELGWGPEPQPSWMELYTEKYCSEKQVLSKTRIHTIYFFFYTCPTHGSRSPHDVNLHSSTDQRELLSLKVCKEGAWGFLQSTGDLWLLIAGILSSTVLWSDLQHRQLIITNTW